MTILVAASGLLTTVQDLGRVGHRRHGVAVGGAVDPLSLRVANILVGNAPGAAALEITLLGPALVFDEPAVVAITGGDLGPLLDGRPATPPIPATRSVPRPPSTGGMAQPPRQAR